MQINAQIAVLHHGQVHLDMAGINIREVVDTKIRCCYAGALTAARKCSTQNLVDRHQLHEHCDHKTEQGGSPGGKTLLEDSSASRLKEAGICRSPNLGH